VSDDPLGLVTELLALAAFLEIVEFAEDGRKRWT